MKKVLFLRNQKTSSTSTKFLSAQLIGSQKDINFKHMSTHPPYEVAIQKNPKFKNAFKIVNIRNPYSQAVSQMFKNLWSNSGNNGLKFENGVFTAKSMNTPFKLEHAIETFQLITRACYDFKKSAQLNSIEDPFGLPLPMNTGEERKECLESWIKQASCKPVKDCLERLDWIHTYYVNALGFLGWQVYTLNDKPMVDHYIVFHKQKQSWKGLLTKLFDKSKADELYNSDFLQNHFAKSEEYLSKYDYADFYTPETKKMVYFLRQPEIDYHKWKFNNNN